MDSTAAFAPDSAFHPEDLSPLSAPLQPHSDDESQTPATHWLSQAMALWLQPLDAPSDSAPALAPTRTAH